jgi:hypothetical protein
VNDSRLLDEIDYVECIGVNRFECLVHLWPSCLQWLSLSSAHLPFMRDVFAQLLRHTVPVLLSLQQIRSTSLPTILAIS